MQFFMILLLDCLRWIFFFTCLVWIERLPKSSGLSAPR